MDRIIDALNVKMPAGLNLDDPFYRALIGDASATPAVDPASSAAFRTGAIANEYEALRAYIDSVVKNIDLDAYAGETLDTIVEFFSGVIERYFDEPDDDLRRRFKSVVRRNQVRSWMTAHSMKSVLAYYYDPDNIYVVENAVETDLVTNGDFEDTIGVEWTLTTTGTAALATSGDEAFDGGSALKFSVGSGETCSAAQTFSSLAAGSYDVRFCALASAEHVSAGATFGWKAQRASDSYYFDASSLSWTATDTLNEAEITESGVWTLGHGWVVLDSTDDVTITFDESAGSAVTLYLDRVQFGVRDDYPYGQVWLLSQGQIGAFMGLWHGDADPTGTGDYAYADYLDQSYIGGVDTGTTTQEFDRLVDSIRPAGTKWEVVNVIRNVA